MMVKNNSKNRVGKAIFGLLFGIIGIFGGLVPLISATPVYAEPEDVVEMLENGELTEEDLEAALTEEGEESEETSDEPVKSEKTCKESLGALGWLVCPATGSIAKAVDWLYEKIEDVLVINPVEIKDGAPIYEVWKYIKGITNILFIIFLMIMVYSQITGLGITNYGLKKTLPKLIVGAIVVNLSFVICSLAVDASNIIGGSLRGVFTAIEESTMQTMTASDTMHVSMTDMYYALSGGVAFAGVGVPILFETGAIWMMIPTVLGAIVSVVIGLVTIAMRQAVVAILIMIAPMAIVAYILPNTGKWFQQWKQLLIGMLVFYPMFSLLFGASSLAGWAIIASAKDGFWLLLGVAVQIFPLFFSWKMMSMSGTFLSTINARMHAIAAKPLATNQRWAESRREATRQKYLASNKVYTPSLKLAQFVSNRRIAREVDTKEDMETVSLRGQAYAANAHYRKDGTVTREGERAYEAQARRMRYQREILRDKNNFNKGLGILEATKANASRSQRRRLDELDILNVNQADYLKFEQARTEKIDYDNAVGFHKRMEDAMNAHFDEINWEKRDKDGKLIYKRHFETQVSPEYTASLERYNAAKGIMEGNALDTQYAAAYAAHNYDTQAKIIMTKFQKYFELTPPTKDVEYRLHELSRLTRMTEDGTKFDIKAADNIDAIISGMRVLNQRGDTDLVKSVMDDLLDKKYGGMTLGTHASQALAGFLMFDVKDNDPFLRRFGKYINLETARAYNKNERKENFVTIDEYIKGYHDEFDPETGKTTRMYAKKPMVKLLEGTSFDNIERTAMSNMDDSLKMAYGYDPNNKSKPWDRAGWLKKLKETMTAIEPQLLSANQKMLSGGEPINSLVKFWTGYDVKPKIKKNDKGEEEFVLDDKGEQIFDIAPIWNNKEFKGFEKELKAFYENNVVDFYRDQTTAQVLNSRTDWRNPTYEHLTSAYLNDKGLSPEEREKRRQEYGAARARVLAKYRDAIAAVADDPKAKRKLESDRDKELMALKEQRASDELIKILGESGKLKQIYRTRGGGTAINSKDWLRRIVHLDDEERLYKEVGEYDKRRRMARNDQQEADSAEEDYGALPRIYDEKFREKCKAELYDMYDVMRDDLPETFFGATMEAVHEWFGKGNSIIEHEYSKYYDDHKDLIEVKELSKYLDELLDDMSKYPDA